MAPPEPLDGRDHQPQLPGDASASDDYVLRLPGKDTSLLGISRDAERLANEAAARLGIAPEVAAAGDRFLVTAFLECRPMDADRAARGTRRRRRRTAGVPRLRG